VPGFDGVDFMRSPTEQPASSTKTLGSLAHLRAAIATDDAPLIARERGPDRRRKWPFRLNGSSNRRRRSM
jgi:hypothetical protein